MAIQINGTTGISGVDGSAGTPALQGQDTNTGISFGTDEVNVVTGGNIVTRFDSSGRVLIGQNDTTGVDAEADDLVVSSTAHTGITVRSGNSHNASLYFADQDAVRQGRIEYSQSGEFMRFNTSGTECFRFGDSGQFGIAGANYGTSGQVLTRGGPSAAPSWADAPTGWTYDSTGTSLTGSSVSITGIPSDAQAIHVVIDGLSTSAHVEWDILVGTSSGDTTSGYNFTAGYYGDTSDQRGSTTDAFTTKGTSHMDYINYAIMKLERADANGNRWYAHYRGRVTGQSKVYYMNGYVDAGGTLDRVTISPPSGTLDAGTVYVHYRVE